MNDELARLDEAARAAVDRRDWQAAAAAFGVIAAQVPDNPRPWYSLGLAQLRGGLGALALPSLRRALVLTPAHAGALSLLPSADGRSHGHRRAAVLPDAPAASVRVAAGLRQEAGDAGAAIALFDRVLARDPEDRESLVNRAMALIEAGRKSAALADIERALRLDPDDHRARWSRGWMRLGSRDWGGVADYAARWLEPEPDSRQRLFDVPLWTGGPLATAPLLLWGQFGVGDEILFASLAGEAAQRAGGGVVIETDARLVGLFARSLPGATVVPRSDPPDPRIAAARPAAQSSTARLPALLPREVVLAPRRTAFLAADPERVEHWRARFAAFGPAPHLGLAWRSGNLRTAGRKSVPLAELAPLLRASSGTWISLQYDPDPQEIAAARAARRPVPLDNPSAGIRDDLEDLAAQIAALDAVVTVSGVNAHLAGALGVPGLVLMQRDPLWFWFEDGETVPWYPSLTILRQRGTAWTAVIAEAARRVAASCGAA